MNFEAVNIKGTKFQLAIADTEELQTKGLSGVSKLGPERGMLFIFTEPLYVNMIMHDMNFPLDFIYLDENWNILQLDSLDQNDTRQSITEYPTSMIIEVPQGTIQKYDLQVGENLLPDTQMKVQTDGVRQFKKGGRFERVGEKIYEIKVDDIKPEEGRLQILNNEGEVVANVDPNCTIFSREHTDELIKQFKKKDHIALGKSLLKILDIHDNQEQEYVRQ